MPNLGGVKPQAVLDGIAKPQNDLQFLIYSVLASALIGFFLWLKFGQKSGESKVKGEVRKALDKELESLSLKIPIGNDNNDTTGTAIFRTETRSGFDAITAQIERIEKHYDQNFRRLEGTTLPMLFEQVSELTKMVVELKTALKIYREEQNGGM